MDKLRELNGNIESAVNELINFTRDSSNKIEEEVYKRAPEVVYNVLCRAYCNECQKYEGKKPNQIPRAKKILSAIEVVEELFPELRRNG
jgi:hypothetical protein